MGQNDLTVKKQSYTESYEDQFFSVEGLANAAWKWGGRGLCAGMFGYYVTGLFYEKDWFHPIERVFVVVFKYFFGRVGLGAAMPKFQFAMAWTVRIGAGIIGAKAFDYGTKGLKRIHTFALYITDPRTDFKPSLDPSRAVAVKPKKAHTF